jgi:error-prone DNA polymerase
VLPPGRGRGSSVSSIVCYLTGLSHVDPVKNELLLGRFLNEEITSLPDIDLDFPRDVRAVLLPRVHERYGRDRSALVAAFPTYKARGAIRELGKALGLPRARSRRRARVGGVGQRRSARTSRSRWARTRAEGRWAWLSQLADEAHGPAAPPLAALGRDDRRTRPARRLLPGGAAAMTGRQMVHWDKDSCSDAGF